MGLFRLSFQDGLQRTQKIPEEAYSPQIMDAGQMLWQFCPKSELWSPQGS